MTTTLQELNSVLDSDPLLCEVGIVVAENAPAVALMEGHKLGLAVSCLAALFKDACTAADRTRRRTDPAGLAELAAATRVLVLLNGDNGAAWNVRRSLVLRGTTTTPAAELHLTDLSLSRHPKSGEAFAMRRWLSCCKQLSFSIDIDDEFALCERCATRYPSNYLAWEHRHWTLRRALGVQSAAVVLSQQLAWSEVWMRRHVSDHAGVHYRESVLLAMPSDVAAITWIEEFALLRNLVRAFPGHEALWMHFRFLAHYWCCRVRGFKSSVVASCYKEEEKSEDFDCDAEKPLTTAELHGKRLPMPSLSGMLRFINATKLDVGAWNHATQAHFADRLLGWLQISGLHNEASWN